MRIHFDSLSYNYNYSKLPISPSSQSRYQLRPSSKTVLHIISVNISALSHIQVGDKQEWSDNTNYIILLFATLPLWNCFCEEFSAFNKTYTYIRQRYKKCVLWRFIAWYIQNSARQPLWDSGILRQHAAEKIIWCCSKNTSMFVILCNLEMRLIALTYWHSWTKWHVLCFTTVTVPPYQRNDIQTDFCTVLLICCVAAWTDCWLCDSVQKYCCTVTSGGEFFNWFKK